MAHPESIDAGSLQILEVHCLLRSVITARICSWLLGQTGWSRFPSLSDADDNIPVRYPLDGGSFLPSGPPRPMAAKRGEVRRIIFWGRNEHCVIGPNILFARKCPKRWFGSTVLWLDEGLLLHVFCLNSCNLAEPGNWRAFRTPTSTAQIVIEFHQFVSRVYQRTTT